MFCVLLKWGSYIDMDIYNTNIGGGGDCIRKLKTIMVGTVSIINKLQSEIKDKKIDDYL